MNATTFMAFGGRVILRLQMKAVIVACLLAGAILSVLIWSLMIGSYGLSPAEVIATLMNDAPSDTAATVVWEFRFPRTLTAFMVGAFLALSGAALQYVTRNPLADPSLVGVSQGAALVVVTVTVLAPGFGFYWRPVLAFCRGLGGRRHYPWHRLLAPGRRNPAFYPDRDRHRRVDFVLHLRPFNLWRY